MSALDYNNRTAGRLVQTTSTMPNAMRSPRHSHAALLTTCLVAGCGTTAPQATGLAQDTGGADGAQEEGSEGGGPLGGTGDPSEGTGSTNGAADTGVGDEDGGAETTGGAGMPPVRYECSQRIHIATDGSDQNPGTAEAPLRDIALAVEAAVPGDCFLVHAGVYSVSSPIAFTETAGTEAMPIVLWSVDGQGEATLDSAAQSFGPALLITTDYIVVDGFDFINMPLDAGEQTVVIRGLDQGRGVGTTLRRNRITGGFDHLKVNQGATGLLIEFNEFYGEFAHIPISMTGIIDSVVRNNYMHDWSPGDNGAVQVKGGSSGVLFDSNVFERVNGLGGALTFGDGCDASCNLDPDSYAGVELIAINNVFREVGRAFDLYGCRDCAVLHNTIVGSGTQTVALKFGSATTGGVTRATQNARVLNNIVANPAADLWAFVQVNDGSAAGMVMDYNVIWNGSAAVDLGGSHPAGADQNSMQLDPGFVAAGDFALAAGSPAGDAALAVPEVSWDHLGQTRPAGAGPDIGAYESL